MKAPQDPQDPNKAESQVDTSEKLEVNEPSAGITEEDRKSVV